MSFDIGIDKLWGFLGVLRAEYLVYTSIFMLGMMRRHGNEFRRVKEKRA